MRFITGKRKPKKMAMSDNEPKSYKGTLSHKIRKKKLDFTKTRYSVDFQLEVDNFLSLPAQASKRKVFEWCVSEKNLKFEASVYPGGDDEESEGYVCIFTENKSNRDLTSTYQDMKILASDGRVLEHYKDEDRSIVAKKGYGSSWGWTSIKRSLIEGNPSKYLRGQALVVSFRHDIEEESEAPSKYDINWAENIKLEFENGLQNTDITIKCGEEEVKCHKFILGSCSDVFQSYFKDGNDTLESKTNTIVIEDVGPDSVRELIRFIYTNELSTDEYENLCQLIYLADKYNVKSLKSRCEDALSDQMTIDNVADLAVLGKSHNTEALKNTAVDFIAKNSRRVQETEAWANLVKSDPKTMCDILMEVTMKMQPPSEK